MTEIIQINSNTWRFENGFVRFFLLEGKEQAVMIDTGAECPDAAELAATLTDKPLLLLNTHGDGDHTSGTAGFPVIHMHASDYNNQMLKKQYPDTALSEIHDGDVIDPGERLLKIIHIPGHTYGSVAVLDINNRVLYAGDTVQKGNIFMFGSHRDPDEFESSLDKLIALMPQYDCIYASHEEYMLPADYAVKVRDAWKKVLSGQVPYNAIEMFGNKVKAYTTDACGFYCE